MWDDNVGFMSTQLLHTAKQCGSPGSWVQRYLTINDNNDDNDNDNDNNNDDDDDFPSAGIY